MQIRCIRSHGITNPKTPLTSKHIGPASRSPFAGSKLRSPLFCASFKETKGKLQPEVTIQASRPLKLQHQTVSVLKPPLADKICVRTSGTVRPGDPPGGSRHRRQEAQDKQTNSEASPCLHDSHRVGDDRHSSSSARVASTSLTERRAKRTEKIQELAEQNVDLLLPIAARRSWPIRPRSTTTYPEDRPRKRPTDQRNHHCHEAPHHGYEVLVLNLRAIVDEPLERVAKRCAVVRHGAPTRAWADRPGGME